MKKKFIIIFIWLIVISMLVNILYYLIMENGINILMPQIAFKFKYYFREVIDITVDYKNLEENNVISKDNISIKLSNINYQQDIGELNIKLESYTNSNDVLDGIGGILRVYDEKKIFFNGPVGALLKDMKNTKYLLYTEDIYGNVEAEEISNKKLFGKLDYSNLNTDYFDRFDINNSDDNSIATNLTLDLGKGYKIPDKLYISVINFVYKSVDEFMYRKAIEPLGELKFIVEF